MFLHQHQLWMEVPKFQTCQIRFIASILYCLQSLYFSEPTELAPLEEKYGFAAAELIFCQFMKLNQLTKGSYACLSQQLQSSSSVQLGGGMGSGPLFFLSASIRLAHLHFTLFQGHLTDVVELRLVTLSPSIGKEAGGKSFIDVRHRYHQ